MSATGFNPAVLIEHVSDGLASHAEALREEKGLGTLQAQARWLDIQAANLREALEALKPAGEAEREPLELGDRVRHFQSNWAGPVIAIDGTRVTVRPEHPRPKETWSEPLGRFVPTPEDWPGWKPITVERYELRKA